MKSEKIVEFVTRPVAALAASVALGGGGAFLVHEALTADAVNSPAASHCQTIELSHQRLDCLDRVLDQAHEDFLLKAYGGLGCLVVGFGLAFGPMFGELDEASREYHASKAAVK